MKLSPSQAKALVALAAGQLLKSHRYLDGRKAYRLHAPDNTLVKTIGRTAVAALFQ